MAGNSAFACGVLGVACQPCQSGQSCALGTCVAVTNTGGGTGGSGGGTATGGGTGTGGGPGACTASTCAGCCSGNTCQLGNTLAECGANGAACTTCGSGLSCVNGRCQAPSCNSCNCPTGCCQGTVCQPGTLPSACGGNGNACVACGSGTATCSSQRQCVATQCSPANCAGCCDSAGLCQSGTSVQSCGLNGSFCQSCFPLTNTCTAGSCVRDAGVSGGTPAGGACTDVDQCAGEDTFGLKFCTSPVLSDGGQSGWVGGACAPSCFSLVGGMCPSSADYCNGVSCFQSCPAPGAGRSTCRVGYVCSNNRLSDGGVEPNSAHCVPNCNNAPAARCGMRTCLASGYCQ